MQCCATLHRAWCSVPSSLIHTSCTAVVQATAVQDVSCQSTATCENTLSECRGANESTGGQPANVLSPPKSDSISSGVTEEGEIAAVLGRMLDQAGRLDTHPATQVSTAFKGSGSRLTQYTQHVTIAIPTMSAVCHLLLKQSLVLDVLYAHSVKAHTLSRVCTTSLQLCLKARLAMRQLMLLCGKV